jgi:Zn-dependent metalloprotease
MSGCVLKPPLASACHLRDPIHCIIPPYMMDRIETKKGQVSARLRSKAEAASSRSNKFRRQRAAVDIHSALFSAIDPKSKDKSKETKARVAAAAAAKPNRQVYDAGQTENLSGTLVRSEGEPPSDDPAVNEAYDGAGATWAFYWEEYKRNSLDDQGMSLIQTVHYGEEYNNAFWDGKQMVYGDGDDELFGRFTSDLDIIAHELSHGVIQATGGLVYLHQSGALNESFADVFGSLVKQRALNQDANQADWLIGSGVLLGGNYALRSMKAPGTAYLNHPILGDDPQPALMSDFKHQPVFGDFGGVHLNSGIPNHAFYLAAMQIGGPAWKKAGLIWYRALTEKLSSICHFYDCATATIEAASDEFGDGSLEQQAVRDAWKTVEVL